MKSEEDYQKAIELTPEQKKAWTQLVRAVNRCKKENIYFYQNLDTLAGLNGNNIRDIHTSEDLDYKGLPIDHPSSLHYKIYSAVETACSFADDNHFIELVDD